MPYKGDIFPRVLPAFSFDSLFSGALFWGCFCWWHRLLLLGKQWETSPNTFACAVSICAYVCTSLEISRRRRRRLRWCQDWWLPPKWYLIECAAECLPWHIQYCWGLSGLVPLKCHFVFSTRILWQTRKVFGRRFLRWVFLRDAADTEWDKWWQVCRPICELNRLAGATHTGSGHNQSSHSAS